jgi:hypothetical protein
MPELAAITDIFSRLAAFFGTSRGAVVGKLINVAGIWLAAWLALSAGPPESPADWSPMSMTTTPPPSPLRRKEATPSPRSSAASAAS